MKLMNRPLFVAGLAIQFCGNASVLAGDIAAADAAFREGRFAEAEKLYQPCITDAAAEFQAKLRLGEIALLSNRLSAAEEWLDKARELKSAERRPVELLAEVHYRRDEFGKAAALQKEIGADILAAKLASFGDRKPYDSAPLQTEVRIPFVSTDPLPLLQGRVNEKDPVFFLIDTGGAELILNTSYAESVGAVRFGAEKKRFAGDAEAVTEQARVDSFQLGDVRLQNVPVHLLDTTRFAMAAGGRRVDGIIGTLVLNRFIFTLDYPGGALILRPGTAESSAETAKQAVSHGDVVVPYWMAGDHIMVAWGRANQGPPRLFFLDTGLAGGGFTCPESTVKEVGVELPLTSFEGVGGGGTVRVTPFTMPHISLGDAIQKDVMSFFGPFPSSLEERFGFRIAGIVSHGFLRPYRVTFDPVAMKVYLRPAR